jgi:hypothetical protein
MPAELDLDQQLAKIATALKEPPPSPNAFAVLVEALYGGQISEVAFIKDAHQQGFSLARIEWELEQLKMTDGVLA